MLATWRNQTLNPKTLVTLEYPKVLQKLAAYTAFSASRELALALEPSSDLEVVRARQQITSEGVRVLQLRPDTTVGAAHDIRDLIRQGEIGGAIQPAQLLDIESTLVSSRTLRVSLLRLSEGREDELAAVAQVARRLANLPMLEQAINRTISPSGEVLDTASPKLASVRSGIKEAHGRLIDRLNTLLYSEQWSRVLQEPIITTRNNRYVFPVKSDFKGQVRGIIHDQSGSGATVFMEPLATVELNNTWRQLQLEEQDEIERVLRALAAQIGGYGNEIRQAVEALAEIDLALAKAKYSVDSLASEPALLLVQQAAAVGKTPRDFTATPGLHFKNARHPLIPGKVVPITIELGNSFRALVITGPNTGGKTVSLKTVGLLSLMVQAGLHIPVDQGSTALIFDQIFADIGDEQSIEQSLSTFSSHLTNIVAILREARTGALILLDELGAGTDPLEGSALARGIINDMMSRNILLVATTHYSELKSYAYSTPGVENASVEFNVETLSPTYRLTIGLPGRSNALAIARRLGLPGNIIEGAQELVSPQAAEVESLLAGIRIEREQATHARLDAQQKSRDVAQLQRDLRAQLRNIERLREKAVEEAREQAEEELKEARRRLREASSTLEQATSRQALADSQRQLEETQRQVRQARGVEGGQATSVAQMLATSETGVIPAEAPQRQARQTGPVATPTQPAAKEQAPRPLQPGDRVFVESLASEGEVVSAPGVDGEVEVALGAFKMRVPVKELRRIGGRQQGSVTLNIAAPMGVAASPGLEYDMRGWRAEEVEPALDRYLNDASMAGLPYVRIIHGKGTGVLRQVVRDLLAKSSLVESYGSAAQQAGGDGVTVAKLSGR